MALEPYKVRVPLETGLSSFVSLGQKYMSTSHREVSILRVQSMVTWLHIPWQNIMVARGRGRSVSSQCDGQETDAEGISFSSASEGSVHGGLVLCTGAERHGRKMWQSLVLTSWQTASIGGGYRTRPG